MGVYPLGDGALFFLLLLLLSLTFLLYQNISFTGEISNLASCLHQLAIAI